MSPIILSIPIGIISSVLIILIACRIIIYWICLALIWVTVESAWLLLIKSLRLNRIKAPLTYTRISYPIDIWIGRGGINILRMHGIHNLIWAARITRKPITKRIWIGRNKRMTRHVHITVAVIIVTSISNPLLWLLFYTFPWVTFSFWWRGTYSCWVFSIFLSIL